MRAPRVTLVNPKATYADEIAQKCFPPVGLLYLAASLEADGALVDVIDANALRLDDEACVSRVRAYGPDLVGMPVYAETAHTCARTLERIRRACPAAAIVVGGPQPSASPAWVLREIQAIDYVLAGEAERTLPLLARAVVQQRIPSPTEISGLTTRDATGPSVPARLPELDRIPRPARHLVDDVYKRRLYYALLVADRRIDCLVTSRGCPHRCHFCSNDSSRIRFRSVDECLEEMESLRSRGIRTVEILDDNFTASEARALELLDRIRQERFGLALRIKSRADAVTEKLMAACRRAGVYQVSIGAESGSLALLQAMNKRITPAQIRRAVRLVLDEGISCHTSWIVGYPGETLQTLSETAAFVAELKPTTAGFSVLTPYPGTHVYEEAKRDGTLEGDWSAASSLVPWVRLPWTRSRRDLLRAKRALMRQVYFRPYYVAAYGRRIVQGANWTLARYAAQELRRTLSR